MTRTTAREIAIQISFAISQSGESADEALEKFFDKEYFSSLAEENELYADYPSKKQLQYIEQIVRGTSDHRYELDEKITKYSRGWKLSRISAIAATIMRTAMFEVLYMDDVPDNAAINEAIELSKGYEEQETVSFINGILGSFMREERAGETSEETAGEASEQSIETEEIEGQASEEIEGQVSEEIEGQVSEESASEAPEEVAEEIQEEQQ